MINAIYDYIGEHGHPPFMVGYGEKDRKKLKCKKGCGERKSSESGMFKAIVGKMLEDSPEWCVTRAPSCPPVGFPRCAGCTLGTSWGH